MIGDLEFWAEPLGELAGEGRRPGARAPAAQARDRCPPEGRAGRDDTAPILADRRSPCANAVYEAIPKARRALLHERVADWLGHLVSADRLGEVEELLGYHYVACRRPLQLGAASPGHPSGRSARAGDRAPEDRLAGRPAAAARQDDERGPRGTSRAWSRSARRAATRTRLAPADRELGTVLVSGGGHRAR